MGEFKELEIEKEDKALSEQASKPEEQLVEEEKQRFTFIVCMVPEKVRDRLVKNAKKEKQHFRDYAGDILSRYVNDYLEIEGTK